MKTFLMLAALLPATGCLVVPTKKTTTTDLGKEIEIVRVADHGVELVGQAKGPTITVQARHKRDCERRHLAVSRVVKTTHAKLGGTKDIRGKIFGALLAPVTIPVSALITGVVVASSEADAQRVTKIEAAEKQPCIEVAADLPIRVTLASGATREMRTDKNGELSFDIPKDEPYVSTVIARAESTSTSIEYRRPMPPVVAVREATRGCAGKHGFTGDLKLTITIGASGTATNVALDAGDNSFATCVTSSIASLEFAQPQRNKSLVFPFSLR